MTAAIAQRQQAIEWSVASQALPGESVSGDLHVVATWDGGALVAVIDGLGHGGEATLAAQRAAQELEARAREPVMALVQHCHVALRETRGVVMTLVSLDAYSRTLSVIGIGNVETMLFRADPQDAPKRESVLLRGGVVGYTLPALQTSVLPVSAGDVVVFATDGMREDFSDIVNPADPLPQIVEKIMTQKFRGTDDGLVLACKYVGTS